MSLPRVTEVLSACGLGPDFSGVPVAVLEAARRRGSLVHAAIFDAIVLGVETPPAEVAPWFSGYQKFLHESDFAPIPALCEGTIVHTAWEYCGHPDAVGWLHGRRTLVDWKSCETLDVPPATYQMAGYRLALDAAHPEAKIQDVVIVQLRSDGTYRIHPPAATPHPPADTFLAALVTYRSRRSMGRIAE